MRSFSTLITLLLVAVVQATSSAGNRLLVVLNDVSDRESYSKFLGDIQERGFSITYDTPRGESLALFVHGERTYDHVILFPTKGKGLGPNLTPKILLEFINAKGNILVALSSLNAVPTHLVSLLAELDISLPAERTGLVVDHFNYDIISAADKHDVILLPPPVPTRSHVKNLFDSPSFSPPSLLTFPRSVGQVLGQSTLLTPIVRAPPTAYSYNHQEQVGGVASGDGLFAAGAQLALVTAMQARNNARVMVVGSAEMLQDAWLDQTMVQKPGDAAEKVPTMNREFAKIVSGWTFQEIGVLRVNWIEHRLDGSEEVNPAIYRIKNDVTYTISISEYSWDSWVPFIVPPNDALQLEFSMLSPFHRLQLRPAQNQTSHNATDYAVSFGLPDQHGIFNFMVNYKRPFLSNIEQKKTVSVRHMAHDEWPRSFAVSGAWPWIMGISATVTGWLAFVLIWMFSKPVGGAGYGIKVKKTQ